MLISSDREEHIRHLEGVLTTLGKAREDVTELLEKELEKEVFKKVAPEVVGVFMFMQNSIATQIRRVRARRD